jgi:hypothetical protein
MEKHYVYAKLFSTEKGRWELLEIEDTTDVNKVCTLDGVTIDADKLYTEDDVEFRYEDNDWMVVIVDGQPYLGDRYSSELHETSYAKVYDLIETNFDLKYTEGPLALIRGKYAIPRPVRGVDYVQRYRRGGHFAGTDFEPSFSE